jgi:hypothetical protein
VEQRPAQLVLLLDSFGIDGNVHRPGGDAQESERNAELDERVRQARQRSEYAEERNRSDGERAAEAIEQRARDAHRSERSESDEEQCQPELSV